MKKIILLVAVALGMLTTSCNKENEDLIQTPITISANYNAGGEKIAYHEDGVNINATWETGDELIVCWNNHKNTLTLANGAGSSSATFTGSITGSPTANSTLICFVKDRNNPGAVTVSDNGDYLYTDGTFLSQDGTLAGAAKCNLYYGTCHYGDGSNINCTFNVNTSMMKFKVYAPAGISEGTPNATLTYKSGNTELAKATFTVGTDGINIIYLTIPAGLYNGEQTLVYSSGEISETETLSSTQANFVAGQTYSKTLLFSNTPIENPLEIPLTFEANHDWVSITFTPGEGMILPIEYSLDDGLTWSDYIEPIWLIHRGDKISFRGDNPAYCKSNYHGYGDESTFSIDGYCYVYGNIMSLVNSTDFATITTFTADNKYAFRGLFLDCNGFLSHPSKDLILPATTLAEGCYYEMFGMCDLNRAPELPATTLAKDCYKRMFYNCSDLTTTPRELPATTLNTECYSSMFQGCTSLTNAPSLPATTLSEGCYYEMFEGCLHLITAPELPATTMARYCYSNMFKGCTSLTTAPELPATLLSDYCYYSMFAGCIRLSSAPELPATTLFPECYRGMFAYCSRLNYVKCLATTNLDYLYYGNESDWLYRVAASGTFIKAAGVNWITGSNGIPEGWTILEE